MLIISDELAIELAKKPNLGIRLIDSNGRIHLVNGASDPVHWHWNEQLSTAIPCVEIYRSSNKKSGIFDFIRRVFMFKK